MAYQIRDFDLRILESIATKGSSSVQEIHDDLRSYHLVVVMRAVHKLCSCQYLQQRHENRQAFYHVRQEGFRLLKSKKELGEELAKV
jgi:hypothetical protein